MYVVEYNCEQIAGYLMEHGSDPEVTSYIHHRGETISAINLALHNSHFKLFNLCLEHSNALRAIQQNRGAHNACINILEKSLIDYSLMFRKPASVVHLPLVRLLVH